MEDSAYLIKVLFYIRVNIDVIHTVGHFPLSLLRLSETKCKQETRIRHIRWTEVNFTKILRNDLIQASKRIINLLQPFSLHTVWSWQCGAYNITYWSWRLCIWNMKKQPQLWKRLYVSVQFTNESQIRKRKSHMIHYSWVIICNFW